MAYNRPVKIGIIGGSGMDNPTILEDRREQFVETPYGKPSDALIFGKVNGVECILLARHGRGHVISPSHLNYRANIWALREAGCTHVIVTTACGSLREDKHPGDIVILDQFIDRTRFRPQTFYDGEAHSPKGVCHIQMAHPFCDETRQILIETTKELGIHFHPKGTNITVEGPRFSTKAESKVWRQEGADIINMTTVPEVVLAKELGMCYAAIALVTDYDCWRDDIEHVSADAVMKIFKENAGKAHNILIHAVPKIVSRDWTSVLKAHEDMIKASTIGGV